MRTGARANGTAGRARAAHCKGLVEGLRHRTQPAPTGLPPSRADGSPENFSPAAFNVAHMYVCIASSVIRLWYSSRKLWGKSFQESRRRAQAGHAARAPSHSEKSELGIYSRHPLYQMEKSGPAKGGPVPLDRVVLELGALL